MADYELYYWPVPFRGQFIRAMLAYAGQRWSEHDPQAIQKLMAREPRDQPAPFMGPPLLVVRETGFALAQMPAIALYLGEVLGLLPQTPELRAATVKTVNDANDVIDEITRDGGRDMWTRAKWNEFLPRLARWMTIWEATGMRHGLRRDAGFLLGGDRAGVADIVTATLWSTMGERFPAIAAMLADTAPATAALTARMQAMPALAALAKQAFAQYGAAYCGGEIEKSLRKVV